MRGLFIVVRIAGVISVVAAIAAQLSQSLTNWSSEYHISDPTIQVVNFFSFFTIDSNVLTAVAFAIGAIFLIQGRTPEPRWFSIGRASITAFMAVTGIVYNLLLRGIDLPQGTTVPWSNEILHVVAPLLIVLDWLFAPGRNRLEWKNIWIIVIFPFVWAVYTMIRGPLTFDAVTGKNFWYPYPFLNPNIAPEGYFSVAFYVVLIAAIVGGVGAAIIWVSRRSARWPLRST